MPGGTCGAAQAMLVSRTGAALTVGTLIMTPTHPLRRRVLALAPTRAAAFGAQAAAQDHAFAIAGRDLPPGLRP